MFESADSLVEERGENINRKVEKTSDRGLVPKNSKICLKKKNSPSQRDLQKYTELIHKIHSEPKCKFRGNSKFIRSVDEIVTLVALWNHAMLGKVVYNSIS